MSPLTSMIPLLFSLLQKNQAYLDPGSGSFILQLIIAGLVGAGFLLRGYWSKITSFFRGSSMEKEEEDGEDSDEA